MSRFSLILTLSVTGFLATLGIELLQYASPSTPQHTTIWQLAMRAADGGR